MCRSLTLAPLWGSSRFLKTWLLAFLYASVARKETKRFQCLVEVFVPDYQGAGDTKLYSLSLTLFTTTSYLYREIEIFFFGQGFEWGKHHFLHFKVWEIFSEWQTVYGNFTTAFVYADASTSGFAATHATHLFFLRIQFYHILFYLRLC